MRTIIDNYGDEVTVHDICYLIYQGFGQRATESFVNLFLKPEGVEVADHYCTGCESIEPFHDNACLICGLPYPQKENN